MRKVRHYDSRHSSLADPTYCCPTSSLAIFGFLSNEAAPQARLAVVSADRLDPLGCESAVGDGQHEFDKCRRRKAPRGERHAVDNHRREQLDVTRNTRCAAAMDWVEDGCVSGQNAPNHRIGTGRRATVACGISSGYSRLASRCRTRWLAAVERDEGAHRLAST
jgi:hypothetical protein